MSVKKESSTEGERDTYADNRFINDGATQKLPLKDYKLSTNFLSKVS